MKKLRDEDNMGKDEYPVTTTSALNLLIFTEGGIWGNHKLSTYENCGGRGRHQHKYCMGQTLSQQNGGKEDNATLVPGKYGKLLNATFYNCCNPGHLEYN